MIKIMLVLYRKQGMSPAEFKRYYEDVHVKLGLKHLGKLYKKYIRNYLDDPYNLTAYAGRGGGVDTHPLPDVITEIYLQDEAALAEWNAIAGDPTTRQILLEDEDNFLDRSRSLISIVSCEEGPLVSL